MNFTRIFLPLLLINFFLSVSCLPMHHNYYGLEKGAGPCDNSNLPPCDSSRLPSGVTGINVNDIHLIVIQVQTEEEEGLNIFTAETRSPFVIAGVKNNILYLWKAFQSYPVHGILKIKSLNSIDISSNGSVQLGTGTNVQFSSLDITVSGNGKLTAQHLTTTIECTITVKDNGIVDIPDLHTYALQETVVDKGSITIKGHAEHQTIKACDNAQINQQGLTGKEGTITLENTAVAHLNIQRFLNARVEDDRKLTNHGNGQVIYAAPDKKLWYLLDK